MNILVDKKFYSGVPYQLNKRIRNFIDRLSVDPHNMFTHGNYCRKIKGTTNKYKFRVNSGDRVVFQYELDAVKLLRFCHHDEQIRVAERINTATPSVQELKPEYHEYVEDAFDSQIDSSIIEDITNHLLDDNLDLALNMLKGIGAEHSNKAKNIRKIQGIEESRAYFFEHIDEVSKISINTSWYENQNKEKKRTALRQRDIKYAFNRIFSELQCFIHPFAFFIVCGTAYICEVFLEDLSSKHLAANRFADFYNKNINNIIDYDGIAFFVILKASNGNIIPSLQVDIQPYEKTFRSFENNSLYLVVSNTLGSYANNYRILKSEEKMKSINRVFLGE